jgi:small subunit ribosomal protein S16
MTGRPLDLEGVTIVDDPNATEGDAVEPAEPSLEAWYIFISGLCSGAAR